MIFQNAFLLSFMIYTFFNMRENEVENNDILHMEVKLRDSYVMI